MLRALVRIGEGPVSRMHAPSKTRHRSPVSAWGLPLGIALVSAVLAWLSTVDPRWHALLDYRRMAVADGEAWRLFTAHLMHLSVEHAALDVTGLILVAWIFSAEIGPRLQATVCIVGIAFIDAALWTTQVDRYVGLSGVLHGWFAAGVVGWLVAPRVDRDATRKRLWGAALLIGLAVKLTLESRHQAFWLDGAVFPVVTTAHRWGAAAGIVSGVGAVVLGRRAAAGDAGRVSRGR